MLCYGSGREMDAQPGMKDFEGLVIATSRKFATQVRREEDDLAQELRVRVWRALQTWSPEKGTTIQAYVFQCITNKVKDYKRDAAREAQRNVTLGLTISYMDDVGEYVVDMVHSIDHDGVYGAVDEGLFAFPSTLTQSECEALVMLMMYHTKREVARRMSVTQFQLDALIRGAREKLADWKPGNGTTVVARVALIA